MIAKATGSDLSQVWEDDEEVEPTNPYRVLHIHSGNCGALTKEEIEDYYQSHKELQGGGDEPDPAALLLHARLDKAHSLLMDSARREKFDQMIQTRKDEKTWAILRYKDGLYEGNVRPSEGKSPPVRHGKGVTILVSGDRFEGSYQTNKRHGFGTQFWTNGDVYQGFWEEDRMHGRGEYYYSSGSWYAGAFQKGKRHGDGFLSWPDGDTYSGQFVEGQRTGKGEMKFFGGGSYNGKWRNGQEHGEGKYTSDTDGSYVGQFADGCFHGNGLQILPNNDRYEGQFITGKRTGTGVYDWINGDRYEGEMNNNQRVGHGNFTTRNRGLIYDGQWQDNSPEGVGSLKVLKEPGNPVSAFQYEGQWEAGLKEGKGILSFPNGSKYTGDFVSDLKHGQGIFEWKDGSQWEGTFSQDLQHGMGMHRERCAEGKGEYLDRYYHGLLCKRDGKLVKAVQKDGAPAPPQDSTVGSTTTVAFRLPDREDAANENIAQGSSAFVDFTFDG